MKSFVRSSGEIGDGAKEGTNQDFLRLLEFYALLHATSD